MTNKKKEKLLYRFFHDDKFSPDQRFLFVGCAADRNTHAKIRILKHSSIQSYMGVTKCTHSFTHVFVSCVSPQKKKKKPSLLSTT